MIDDVRNSRMAQENAKEENRKKQTEAEKQNVEKKRLSVEFKNLKEGKKATAIKSIEALQLKLFAMDDKLRTF